MSEWIKCDEEMPGVGYPVLVYSSSGHSLENKFLPQRIFTAIKTTQNKFLSNLDLKRIKKVTHWQELPGILED
jgi:hypothetical protein